MEEESFGRAYEQYEGLKLVRITPENAEDYVDSVVQLFQQNFSNEGGAGSSDELRGYFLQILKLETGQHFAIQDEKEDVVSFILAYSAEETCVSDQDVLTSMIEKSGGEAGKVLYVSLVATDSKYSGLATTLFENELLPNIRGDYNAVALRYDDHKSHLGSYYASKWGFRSWEPQPDDNPKIFPNDDPAGRTKKHYMMRMLLDDLGEVEVASLMNQIRGKFGFPGLPPDK